MGGTAGDGEALAPVALASFCLSFAANSRALMRARRLRSSFDIAFLGVVEDETFDVAFLGVGEDETFDFAPAALLSLCLSLAANSFVLARARRLRSSFEIEVFL